MYHQLSQPQERIPQDDYTYLIRHGKSNKYLKLIAFVSFILLVTLIIILNKKKDNLNLNNFLRYKSLESLSSEEIFSIFGGGNLDVTGISLAVSSPGYPPLKSLDHLPWDLLAEPYKSQIIDLSSLRINGKSVDLSSEYISIKWLIDYKTYSGNSISFQVDKVGKLKCSVTFSFSDSSSITSNVPSSYSVTHEFHLMVKYVRREIRTLTEDDRIKFFDALYLMYTEEETSGREKYGDKFRTAEYYLFKHLNGAGTSDCDHWF